MLVRGFIQIVVDEPGMTLAEAKAKAQRSPEEYKVMFVEALEFDAWEEPLVKTEDDEPEDTDEPEDG